MPLTSEGRKKQRKKDIEPYLRQVWATVEHAVDNERKLKGLEVALLKAKLKEKTKLKEEDIENPLVKALVEHEEELNKKIDTWFPFTEKELNRLGVKKKTIISMLKLKVSAKERVLGILKRLRHEKLKELIKDLVKAGVDNIVLLYLLLFVLEELFVTGQLSEDILKLIKRVLTIIQQRCKCPIRARQKQLEYLQKLRDIGPKYADFTGFVLKTFSLSYLTKLGECDASLGKGNRNVPTVLSQKRL